MEYIYQASCFFFLFHLFQWLLHYPILSLSFLLPQKVTSYSGERGKWLKKRGKWPLFLLIVIYCKNLSATRVLSIIFSEYFLKLIQYSNSMVPIFSYIFPFSAKIACFINSCLTHFAIYIYLSWFSHSSTTSHSFIILHLSWPSTCHHPYTFFPLIITFWAVSLR